MQNDVTISLSTVIWLAGGLMGIVACIRWLMTPIKKLDDHERRIGDLEETVEQRKETDMFIMKALNAICNHMVDGNGIEQLKQVRDEYQNEIIKHHAA